jgi:hypothetical protein
MKTTVTYTCFVCGTKFEWGHGCYGTGRPVPIWREMVCDACDQFDGIFPSPELEAKLAAKGIQPRYLSNGFIDLPR